MRKEAPSCLNEFIYENEYLMIVYIYMTINLEFYEIDKYFL